MISGVEWVRLHAVRLADKAPRALDSMKGGGCRDRTAHALPPAKFNHMFT
jgi:hypothetical protein